MTFFFFLYTRFFSGSVQTSEEVQKAEGGGGAAGRGVQSSLHAAGVWEVKTLHSPNYIQVLRGVRVCERERANESVWLVASDELHESRWAWLV